MIPPTNITKEDITSSYDNMSPEWKERLQRWADYLNNNLIEHEIMLPEFMNENNE